MARYALAERKSGEDSQAGSTSANNTTSATLTPPKSATGCYLQASGTAGDGAWVVFDGTTPSATNSLVIPVGAMPVFFPLVPRIGSDLIFRSSHAANGVTLTALWVEEIS
jgi:hypothetical protein